jgi:hypothetical protein
MPQWRITGNKTAEDAEVEAAQKRPSICAQPRLRREIEADYERKRPRDQTAALQKEAATKVELQIWRLGVSKSGGAFLSAFVINRNDFALQQITLRCEFTTAKGSRVHLYKLV